MEYIVKCSFCGETYFVNSNENNAKFSCETCGATNSTDDIIEVGIESIKAVLYGLPEKADTEKDSSTDTAEDE